MLVTSGLDLKELCRCQGSKGGVKAEGVVVFFGGGRRFDCRM